MIAINIQDLSSARIALKTVTFQRFSVHFRTPHDIRRHSQQNISRFFGGQSSSLIRSRKLTAIFSFFSIRRPKHCQIARHRSDAGDNRRFAHAPAMRHSQATLMDVNCRWSPRKVTYTQRLVVIHRTEKRRDRYFCPKNTLATTIIRCDSFAHAHTHSRPNGTMTSARCAAVTVT